eukprot:jgi/Ulvmu1/6064/UM027_0042.1
MGRLACTHGLAVRRSYRARPCVDRRSIACLVKKENTQWKVELAQLNDAIRASVSDEDWEDVGPEDLQLDHSSPKITDQERVYLVAVKVKSRKPDAESFTVEESLEELAQLARTAGLFVVGSASQMLNAPAAATYLGSGKLADIAAEVEAARVDTVIFDDELSPGQQRNLERALGDGVRVADRTALILDIFAQRARTKEGQLQVELAAATYELPRLKRMWTHLERQAGGGQVKGMGEKQKEVDKRLLRDKMAGLRKEIAAVRLHRGAHRKRRRAANTPVVALVGYTNAGKSSLLNRLTAAGVLQEDALFATLDPTTRRIMLPSGKRALLSDTVGFIQKLPTQLVAAFRATLEEVEEADVLLHVVDVSHPQAAKQADTVFRILDDLAVDADIPMVTVWNKVDLRPDGDVVRAVADNRPDTVAVSAETGEGMGDLEVTIEAALEEAMVQFEMAVPYAQGHLVRLVREQGVVRKEHYTEAGVEIAASADLATVGALDAYITDYPPRERVFQWRQEQALDGQVTSSHPTDSHDSMTGSHPLDGVDIVDLSKS